MTAQRNLRQHTDNKERCPAGGRRSIMRFHGTAQDDNALGYSNPVLAGQRPHHRAAGMDAILRTSMSSSSYCSLMQRRSPCCAAIMPGPCPQDAIIATCSCLTCRGSRGLVAVADGPRIGAFDTGPPPSQNRAGGYCGEHLDFGLWLGKTGMRSARYALAQNGPTGPHDIYELEWLPGSKRSGLQL